MKCPFCGQEMTDGTLIANNYRVKFVPEDKKLMLGIWANDSIPLGRKPILGRATVPDAWNCSKCGKYVIDVKN